MNAVAHRPVGTDLMSCAGSCPYGPRCYRVHDSSKIALCPSVSRHTDCVGGTQCNMSHVATAERCPTCVFFVRGRCTRAICTYSHVPVDPNALVCFDFAHMGYCEKGADCGRLHLRQCPDYSNHGTCRNTRYHLPHIDRASQMKEIRPVPQYHPPDSSTQIGRPTDKEWKHPRRLVAPATTDPVPSVESPRGLREFSQQQDFVPLR